MFSAIKARLTTIAKAAFAEVTGTSQIANKYGLDVAVGSSVCTENCTTHPLGASQTFTGTGVQNPYPQVGVMVKSDVAGTLYFDFSNDGTNWDSTFPVAGFGVAAGVSEFHTAVKLGRYFRVRYVNGSTAQSYIRLSTYYGVGFVPSNAPLNQSIGRDSDALSVRPTVFYDEVLRGLRGGVSHFTKFGHTGALTAASGEETIWSLAGTNFTPMTTASTFTIAYTSGSDGSSANGAKTLYFQYVDANGLAQTATHTLSNTGSDVTSFTGLGINRAVVSSSGSTQTNGADITITATTGGSTQAHIPAGEGTTQQCIFHTDANSYAVGKWLWINTNKIAGGSSPRITIKGYVFNRNVATRYEIFRYIIDTGVENTISIEDPVGFRLTPTDVLYFVADTDTNNATVDMRFSLVEYKIS